MFSFAVTPHGVLPVTPMNFSSVRTPSVSNTLSGVSPKSRASRISSLLRVIPFASPVAHSIHSSVHDPLPPPNGGVFRLCSYTIYHLCIIIKPVVIPVVTPLYHLLSLHILLPSKVKLSPFLYYVAAKSA